MKTKNTFSALIGLFTLAFVISLSGCGDNSNGPRGDDSIFPLDEFQLQNFDPILEIEISNITSNSLDALGKVVSLGEDFSWEGEEIKYGFMWYEVTYDSQGNITSQAPIVVEMGTIGETALVSWERQLIDLNSGSEYVVCSYVEYKNDQYPNAEITVDIPL